MMLLMPFFIFYALHIAIAIFLFLAGEVLFYVHTYTYYYIVGWFMMRRRGERWDTHRGLIVARFF